MATAVWLVTLALVGCQKLDTTVVVLTPQNPKCDATSLLICEDQRAERHQERIERQQDKLEIDRAYCPRSFRRRGS